jgi:hypothetical protein
VGIYSPVPLNSITAMSRDGGNCSDNDFGRQAPEWYNSDHWYMYFDRNN